MGPRGALQGSALSPVLTSIVVSDSLLSLYTLPCPEMGEVGYRNTGA